MARKKPPDPRDGNTLVTLAPDARGLPITSALLLALGATREGKNTFVVQSRGYLFTFRRERSDSASWRMAVPGSPCGHGVTHLHEVLGFAYYNGVYDGRFKLAGEVRELLNIPDPE